MSNEQDLVDRLVTLSRELGEIAYEIERHSSNNEITARAREAARREASEAVKACKAAQEEASKAVAEMQAMDATLCKVLRMDQPWPLTAILERLAEAGEMLVDVHDWERDRTSDGPAVFRDAVEAAHEVLLALGVEVTRSQALTNHSMKGNDAHGVKWEPTILERACYEVAAGNYDSFHVAGVVTAARAYLAALQPPKPGEARDPEHRIQSVAYQQLVKRFRLTMRVVDAGALVVKGGVAHAVDQANKLSRETGFLNVAGESYIVNLAPLGALIDAIAEVRKAATEEGCLPIETDPESECAGNRNGSGGGCRHVFPINGNHCMHCGAAVDSVRAAFAHRPELAEVAAAVRRVVAHAKTSHVVPSPVQLLGMLAAELESGT